MVVNPDITAIRAALLEHMERAQITGRALSLKAGLGDSAVRDLLASVDNPRLGTLLSLAAALDIPPEKLFGRRMDVKGIIERDGQIVPVLDGDSPPLSIAQPPDLEGELQAYVLAGNAHLPRYREGDIICVTKCHERDPQECVGHDCVIQLAGTGALVFKTLMRGSRPGVYTLVGPKTADIEDKGVAWVAPVVSFVRQPPNGANGGK